MSENWKKELLGAGFVIAGIISGFITFFLAPEPLLYGPDGIVPIVASRYHLPIVYVLSVVLQVLHKEFKISSVQDLFMIAFLGLFGSLMVIPVSLITLAILV